ncbi:type II secretion system minor pseudopilin GspH [Glaciecola sp. 1036]|uniref:type II secretion system minor pseudopilin GspH n=1 Tax=Alteromonadaceae TaxID=72275 RepID=UPI003CFF28DD
MISLKRQVGFTLLEIMVVVFIIGIVVSVVTYNAFGVDPKEEVNEESRRLQVLIDMASDFAVLNQLQMGLYLDLENNTYEFLSLDEDEQWVPVVNQKFFVKREFPEDIKVELSLDGLPWQDEDVLFDREIFDEDLSIRDEGVSIGDEEDLPPPPPQIFILSSGDITPFELRLIHQDESRETEPFYFALQGKDTIPVELIGPEPL